jgi:dUTP pyrophosphatase
VYDPTGPVAIPDLRPAKAHPTDAAYDLRAAAKLHISPLSRVIVPTTLRIDIPVRFAGLILPRSGLAIKYGITVLNSPGLIDPGYLGEVGVILVNLDNYIGFEVNIGDRIAQLLITGPEEHELQYWLPNAFDDLTSERAESGFGSSGR